MPYAISHDGKSYSEYPYFPTEEEAFKEGRDMMWEAGEKRLYLAKVVEVELPFPFTPTCVTEAIAQAIEEKYPGLGRDWFDVLTDEDEKELKGFLDGAIQQWVTAREVEVTEDAYEEIGNYNLEVI